MNEIEVITKINFWFVSFGNSKLVIENNNTVLLLIKQITFKEYKKEYTMYSNILVNKNYISVFDYENLTKYDFIPNVEHADDESLYLNFKETDILNVIIRASFIEEKQKNTYCKIKNKQKTYLIKDGNGFTKIGKSHDPYLRESTLQSENPTIELLAICEDDIESILHNEYEIFRHRGEWFNLREDHINNIITKYDFKIID